MSFLIRIDMTAGYNVLTLLSSSDKARWSFIFIYSLLSLDGCLLLAVSTIGTLLYRGRFRGCLGLHEWIVTLGLLEPNHKEHADNEEPVQVVGDDRSVGSRVCPAQDGIENAPAGSVIGFRVAALEIDCVSKRIKRS